jgi:hypothetical protein
VYCLRNDIIVVQLDRDSIDYFQLELQTHDVVLAEGLPVESYLDCGNRSAFANGERVSMLFADFAAGNNWEVSDYAPLALRGPDVGATRMHLFARGAALAHAPEAFAGSMTLASAETRRVVPPDFPTSSCFGGPGHPTAGMLVSGSDH